MANQNNYDNYPNGDGRYGAEPRYQAERPQGGPARPSYPEPTRYTGGQPSGGYRAPGRDAGYPDPYRDGRDPGYYREPSRGQAYDPYRDPRGGYDRGRSAYAVPSPSEKPPEPEPHP